MSKGKSALGIVRKYHPEVNRVVDAKKPLTIEVTASDCRSGNSGKASSCAMAKACERDFDGAVISLSVAYMVKGDRATRYRVPASVQREIVSFDRAHKFEPGTYKLKAPNTTEKLGSAKHANKKDWAPAPGGGNRPRSHKTAGIRAL